MSELLRDCPACGRATPHARVYEKWGYPIVRCAGCGLGATVAEGFRAAEYYGRDYFQGERKDGYADYQGSAPVLRREFRRVVDRLRGHASGGRLLELGCAYGYFLDEARPYFDCTGVEVAGDAVAACRARGLDVLHGDLGADDGALRRELETRGPFDAAVMLDCIEHLTQPDATVARVAHLLRGGGTLLVTTGDWDSLHARLAGRSWRLMTPPQHLFFFGRRAMGRLLGRHGLEVVEVRRPWKTVPVGLAAYQLASRLGVRLPSPSRASSLGVPVNLFDTMQVIARRTP